MSMVYDVMVRMTMMNGISGALALISQQVLGVEGAVKSLEKAFIGLNRTSLLAGGALAAVGGYAVISGVKSLTDQAKELSHQLAQIKKLGVDPGDFEKYKAAAYAAHNRVAGVTSVDALKILSTTHSMFGVEGSVKILDPLLKFQQVLGNSMGDYDKAAGTMKEMIRGGELMGKFVDEKTRKVDTEKLTHFLELGTRVAAATHGMVDPHTWLMLAQQGGPMLSTMSDEGMLSMAMVAQAMKGPRAGTALQALGRQFLGMKMGKETAEELKQLGFFNSEISETKGGRLRSHITGYTELGKQFGHALQDDPMRAANILLGALQSHGFDTMEKIIPELYKIMGTDTSRRVMHELLRNIPQMVDEKGRIKKGLGLDASKKIQDEEDYEQVERNYEASKQELLMHLGLPMMRFAIPVIGQLTKTLDGFTDWAKKNPETVEKIGRRLLILGAGLTAFGAVAITGALVSLAGPGGLLIGLATAIGAFAFLNWKDISPGLESVAAAIRPYATIAWNLIKIGWDALIGVLKIIPGVVGDVKTALANLTPSFDQLKSAMGRLFDWIMEKVRWLGSFIPGFGGAGLSGADGAGVGGALAGATGGMGSVERQNMRKFPPVGGNFHSFAGQSAVGRGLPGGEVDMSGGGGFNTRGVRNMNPGNIAWGPWARAHGATGGAGSDTGHLVAVFPSHAAGAAALEALAASKYAGGKRSVDALIAGGGGWTPGNHGAAANVARSMGISPHADANLRDPAMMRRFRDGLMIQELGPAGARHVRGLLHGARSGVGMRRLFDRGASLPFAPPTKTAGGPTIENVMVLDGEVVHRSVNRRIVRAAEHSRQSPYFNGAGMFAGPDMKFAVG